jgi:hypothetical protein
MEIKGVRQGLHVNVEKRASQILERPACISGSVRRQIEGSVAFTDHIRFGWELISPIADHITKWIPSVISAPGKTGLDRIYYTLEAQLKVNSRLSLKMRLKLWKATKTATR